MRAELEFNGWRKEYVLPDDSVLVNFSIKWNDSGSQHHISICDDIHLIQSMLGCTAVKVDAGDDPIEYEIYAYVDTGGDLAKALYAYAGMKMIDMENHGLRMSLTL